MARAPRATGCQTFIYLRAPPVESALGVQVGDLLPLDFHTDQRPMNLQVNGDEE